jgi:hypothetical protein
MESSRGSSNQSNHLRSPNFGRAPPWTIRRRSTSSDLAVATPMLLVSRWYSVSVYLGRLLPVSH